MPDQVLLYVRHNDGDDAPLFTKPGLTSLANPNRVRALIGGFAANQREFNRADGEGFALLEEVVATLDPTNPQIAARLLTAMRSWRTLETIRRGHAEAMLRRIAARTSLSPDVRDIVTRSLG